VVPIEPEPHGPPKGWWTVKRNGLSVRHFPGKENAERYATDPEYRTSLAAGKAWEKARGNKIGVAKTLVTVAELQRLVLTEIRTHDGCGDATDVSI
jgi:hypothetical protein